MPSALGAKNDNATIGFGRPFRRRVRTRNRRTAVEQQLSVRAGHAVPGVRGRPQTWQLVLLQGPQGRTQGNRGEGGRELLVPAPAPGPDHLPAHHAGASGASPGLADRAGLVADGGYPVGERLQRRPDLHGGNRDDNPARRVRAAGDDLDAHGRLPGLLDRSHAQRDRQQGRSRDARTRAPGFPRLEPDDPRAMSMPAAPTTAQVKATLSDGTNPVAFNFNPESITISHRAPQKHVNSAKQGQGSQDQPGATGAGGGAGGAPLAQQTQVTDVGGTTISLSDLIINGSGTVDTCKRLLGWSYPATQGSTTAAELPKLTFTWGTALSYKVTISSVDITY